jgi:hypothetical protein
MLFILSFEAITVFRIPQAKIAGNLCLKQFRIPQATTLGIIAFYSFAFLRLPRWESLHLTVSHSSGYNAGIHFI